MWAPGPIPITMGMRSPTRFRKSRATRSAEARVGLIGGTGMNAYTLSATIDDTDPALAEVK
nr:hypothetical protein GCM10017611_02840 [Rhodococcus wratislaviensis]